MTSLKPRVKICCIESIAEARLALRGGVSALGMVSEMPSGPGVIGEAAIAEIVRITPPGVATFLLTSRRSSSEIIAQVCRTGANTVQLTDAVDFSVYAEFRAALPCVKLVQVIHVLGEESLREAEEVAPFVDALVLDSGNPNLAVKVLGGTGNRHDWGISRRIVGSVNVPVFLAGGLKPENVEEAVETVKPFGLDLCSGVRTEGRLDALKVEAFFRALQRIDE